ncbi:MAG: sigma-54 dependent transcriptional regulator [Deltaproteobacteria bacterium]|nr:sigma-54 dependent transcriptional regulator [Deltaproteobacteria bacterium]
MAAVVKSHVTARVLLIDDDDAICGLVSKYLQHHGHSVEVLHEGLQMDRSLQSPFDVVLLDMGLPGIDGLSLLDRITREHPEIAVVMITAAVGVDSIVDAMRRGAFDYLTKPIDLQRLAIVVRNAAEHTRLRLESDGLRAAMLRGDGGPHLICGSQAMSEVISLVERVAASRVPVLIYGEAGAGKELVAHRIHARSRRRDGPFVVVNCAQKPPELLGEKLFGSTMGGGKFDEARAGTLFLDEVGELSSELQARLHRTLHEASLQERRTGGDGDVRVVAATVKHLPTEVSRGTFRADLFYRLNVFSITVPPLKDRKDDIPALARYALARFAARENQPPPSLSDDVLEALITYPWPGNVRELNNTIERMALVASGGIIRAEDLPDEIRAHSATHKKDEPAAGSFDDDSGATVRPLHEVEREMMIAALRETEGNVSEAARRLGIGRATFYRRAQRHGLTRDDGFPG